MKDTFNIEDMALITGLSTRTIRSYIADGFLEGDKSSGAWQFTPEQVDAFLQNKTVLPTLRSKKMRSFMTSWEHPTKKRI